MGSPGRAEVRRSLREMHSLDMIAERARMTRRTFKRRFQQSMGTSFGKWLIQERLTLAQQLLETTKKSIEEVAYKAGFGSATSLRQHFAAQLKVSPARYRRESPRSNRMSLEAFFATLKH